MGAQIMGLQGRSSAELLMTVLLCGAVALGASRESSGNQAVTVWLQNSAGVPRPILSRAEVDASRIFHAAGVEITWNDCSTTHDCHRAPGLNEFVVNIVRDGRTSSDLVYGVAFLDEAGQGKYADVFFRRIAESASGTDENMARLLGTVTAHELGHLLLGLHGHSPTGVMTPLWKGNTLRSAQMGSLQFTRMQASQIKARIGSGCGIQGGTTEFTLVHSLPQKP
jgi:hypothetical protein